MSGQAHSSKLWSVLRLLLRWAERGFAVLGVLFLIYHLAFDLSVIASPSMSPTLQGTAFDNGDWVLTERVSYWLREPRRWEVVAFRKQDGLKVMKRVVGLPGEELSMPGRGLAVNGTLLERPPSLERIQYFAYGNVSHGRSVPCGDGYYMLGDDSRDSEDSRFEGPVQRKQVMGRAWLIVWPPERIGPVNP